MYLPFKSYRQQKGVLYQKYISFYDSFFYIYQLSVFYLQVTFRVLLLYHEELSLGFLVGQTC